MSILGPVDRVIGRYQSQWRTAVRSATGGAVLQAAAYLSLFLLIPAVVDESDGTWWLLFGLAVILVIESIVRLYELAFGYRYSPDVLNDLRLRLGEKLRTIPSEELARRQSGDLSTVLSGNAADATMTVGEIGVLFIRLLVIPITLAIGLAFVDWRLLAAVAVGVLVGLAGFSAVRSKSATTMPDMHAADAASASRVLEYIQGLPVFKATGQIGASSERLVDALEEQGRVLNRSQSTLSPPLAIGAAGAHLVVIGLVAVAAALVVDDSMSAATAAAVAVVAVRLGEPLTLAGSLTSVVELARSALHRIDDVLTIEPLPVPSNPSTISGSRVVFDGVTFSYREQRRPAIADVTFTLEEGSLTALVGPSGSGKTTVARALMRYADPMEGSISVGGTDIRSVEPGELMRHISSVFQDVHLFDGTIVENVRLARPGADDADIARALAAANCESFLQRLPDGMNTRVGEVGGMLSGGERQRVAIARALLKDAPIVILDEPTSALDSDSEVAVQAAVDELVRERTVLVIAHRLSTIARADQILVLEEGRIVERGAHDDLLALDGRYADMWRAQTDARRWTITGA